MAIEKRKVIIALLPFILITIGVLIFVIFFNFTDITFSGTHPYQIKLNDVKYDADNGGFVHFHIRGGNYVFQVNKPSYFDQTIEKTLSWKENQTVALQFVYKPIISTKKLVPAIHYQANTVIADNQNTDLIFDSLPAQTIMLKDKDGNTRIVWSHHGDQACMFNTQGGAMVWQTGKTAALDPNTFDCYPAGNTLVQASFKNNTLFFDSIEIKKNLKDFALAVNPTGTLLLLTEKQSDASQQLSFFDTQTKKLTSLGIFHGVENPRFIGKNTIAIHEKDHTTVLTLPSLTTITLPYATNLATMVYSENNKTFYFVDTRSSANQLSLGNLFTPVTYHTALFAYHDGNEQELYSFPENNKLSSSTMNTDEDTIAFVDQENEAVCLVKITP